MPTLKLYLRTLGVVGTIKALWGYWTHSTFLITIERPDVEHPFVLRVPSTDVPTYKHVFVSREYDFECEVEPRDLRSTRYSSGHARQHTV